MFALFPGPGACLSLLLLLLAGRTGQVHASPQNQTLDDTFSLLCYEPLHEAGVWNEFSDTDAPVLPAGCLTDAESGWAFWNGTAKGSNVTGASVTVKFRGSAVYYYAPLSPLQGNFTANLDGNSTVLSAYSPTLQNQALLFSQTGLVETGGNGTEHVLTLTNADSSFLIVDDFVLEYDNSVEGSPVHDASPSSSNRTASIIGGVLGGLGTVCIFAICLVFWERRRRRRPCLPTIGGRPLTYEEYMGYWGKQGPGGAQAAEPAWAEKQRQKEGYFGPCSSSLVYPSYSHNSACHDPGSVSSHTQCGTISLTSPATSGPRMPPPAATAYPYPSAPIPPAYHHNAPSTPRTSQKARARAASLSDDRNSLPAWRKYPEVQDDAGTVDPIRTRTSEDSGGHAHRPKPSVTFAAPHHPPAGRSRAPTHQDQPPGGWQTFALASPPEEEGPRFNVPPARWR